MAANIFDLTGKVALVTGGSKGLGKAMARGLAEAGADIVAIPTRPPRIAVAIPCYNEAGAVEAVVDEWREALPEAVFTGYLSGADLAKASASADVFVFPSTTDTFGNVVLEAMASGLPAVVSDTGGPRELVKNGVTGYVTRSLDVDDFTTATERLVADPALRETMRANARAAVASRDWSDAFARFWATSE